MSTNDRFVCMACHKRRSRQQIELALCSCGGLRHLHEEDFDSGAKKARRFLTSTTGRRIGQGRSH